MENALDTISNPNVALMQRLQRLEERIADLERGKTSRISYFAGNAAECAAKRAELAGGPAGTCMAMLEDKGGEGIFTNIWVLFPTGWVSF